MNERIIIQEQLRRACYEFFPDFRSRNTRKDERVEIRSHEAILAKKFCIIGGESNRGEV